MPRGRKPSCVCGACKTCRRREIQKRSDLRRGYKPKKSTERVRAWRAANRERDNANARAYYHSLDVEGKAKWRARDQLGRAVRSGKVERQPCEVCGAEQVHGHHDDYSKPLDVRWLCLTHHAEVHSGSSASAA